MWYWKISAPVEWRAGRQTGIIGANTKPAEVSEVAQSNREQPINPSVLKTLHALQREGRPDILNTLITLFLDSARALLMDLAAAAKDGDRAALRQASHALNSASANVGATVLSARCRELETMVREGSVPDPMERVEAIIAEFRRAEAALLAYLAQVTGSTMGISA
jgi:HPt (histidine-containing phosphotransfer) domain-containing protein